MDKVGHRINNQVTGNSPRNALQLLRSKPNGKITARQTQAVMLALNDTSLVPGSRYEDRSERHTVEKYCITVQENNIGILNRNFEDEFKRVEELK